MFITVPFILEKKGLRRYIEGVKEIYLRNFTLKIGYFYYCFI